MKKRAAFTAPDFAVENGTTNLVDEAYAVLDEHGFEVEKDAEAVYLIDADNETATRAGNTLLDHGFRGGICW